MLNISARLMISVTCGSNSAMAGVSTGNWFLAKRPGHRVLRILIIRLNLVGSSFGAVRNKSTILDLILYFCMISLHCNESYMIFAPKPSEKRSTLVFQNFVDLLVIERTQCNFLNNRCAILDCFLL